MSYDLTVFIAGIRTPLWKNLVESLNLACKRYSWQIIFSSCFNLPDDLTGLPNVSLVMDKGHVTRANQKGLLNVDSELVFLSVDDAVFLEDSLDKGLDLWHKQCTSKDLVSMRYIEANSRVPLDYWRMHHHPILRLPGIPETQLFGHHPIMSMSNFYELGGFDCQFEYLTYPLLDYNIRLVKNGGKIYLSETECAFCGHYVADTGDHGPVHEAQEFHDRPIFDEMYRQANDRIKISYNNWKDASPVWHRRFSNGIPRTYEELCINEGYTI